MKPFFLTLTAGLVLTAPVARAQVTINQAALDQLAGIAATPAPQPMPEPTPVVHRIYHHHPKPTAEPPLIAPAIATTAKPAPPMPPLPVAVIPAPILPKIAPPPAAPATAQQAVAKPAPLPKLALAKPAAPKPPPELSPAIITFAAGGAALPSSASATLKPFCATHLPSGQLLTIDAYAAADPSDPSSAPRLSLNRAFAIRDALAACGVPPTAIIPRADGAVPTKNPDTAVISAEGPTQ